MLCSDAVLRHAAEVEPLRLRYSQERPTLCIQASSLCIQSCNHLQPYASQAATPCIPGCDPMHPRLRPHASQAATLCIPGCDSMHPGLRPYVSQALLDAGTLDPKAYALSGMGAGDEASAPLGGGTLVLGSNPNPDSSTSTHPKPDPNPKHKPSPRPKPKPKARTQTKTKAKTKARLTTPAQPHPEAQDPPLALSRRTGAPLMEQACRGAQVLPGLRQAAAPSDRRRRQAPAATLC